MKVSVKWLFLLLFSASILLLLFFSIKKSTTVTLESKLGIFCLKCRAYETGSGISVYGFGLAYCNGEIKKISSYTMNYDEIDKFKLHLKDKGFIKIINIVSEIEQNLKSNDTEKYIYAVEEYAKEIELLNHIERETVLSFFSM